MIRKIIRIDEEKCNGCGACASACHEGAIGMVNGKAKLLREDYCDGLGDCLPACPTDAISFEEREAPAYDEEAVLAAKRQNAGHHAGCPGSAAKTIQPADCPGSAPKALRPDAPHACPGSMAKSFEREAAPHACPGSAPKALRPDAPHVCPGKMAKAIEREETPAPASFEMPSQLRQWPVQIKLVPVNAPYFSGAHLLIAADCTAYAYANFHREFMRSRITLIGCPKLDEGDYSEKLTRIIAQNDIRSLTIVRMEVPCCGGIENAAKRALQASGKFIPWQVVTVSTDGRIIED